jgi:hypothetical protein
MSTIYAPTFGPLSAPERRVKRTTGPAPRTSTLTGGFVGLREFRLPFDGGEIVIQLAASPPAWIAPTVDALSRLLSMPQDWDSYGAPQVDPACVASAIEIALTTMHDRTPSPAVVPTSSGGVQLEWHTRGIDLEIEIRSPSRISACFEDHRKNAAWDTEQLYDFRQLRDALREMARR